MASGTVCVPVCTCTCMCMCNVCMTLKPLECNSIQTFVESTKEKTHDFVERFEGSATLFFFFSHASKILLCSNLETSETLTDKLDRQAGRTSLTDIPFVGTSLGSHTIGRSIHYTNMALAFEEWFLFDCLSNCIVEFQAL